jgi:hypothetical protein
MKLYTAFLMQPKHHTMQIQHACVLVHPFYSIYFRKKIWNKKQDETGDGDRAGVAAAGARAVLFCFWRVLALLVQGDYSY